MAKGTIWTSCSGRALNPRSQSPRALLRSCNVDPKAGRVQRAFRLVVRAQDDSAVEEDEAESRLEALEKKTARKKVRSLPEESPGLPESTWSEWKEGELLPEAWDELNLLQKAAELYTGKRGLLFWLNKLAFGSVIAIAVLWIVFRFVGPQLGLYELRASLLDVNP